MKNLAPDLTRQRLLIEGFYKIKVDRKIIGNYFKHITKSLKLRIYGKPIIFSPGGIGKEENQGYDAFVPLIDSGIAVYIWSNAKFFSIVIYTCKSFNDKEAIAATKRFFKSSKAVFKSF
ncbi:S-adenosylmethionine decarboxylase [Candidatus Woesearchaeota archaeon]|nr:S-adenosylmethionine decarboxylase [Candidatus Woesearchaeota archaeon]